MSLIIKLEAKNSIKYQKLISELVDLGYVRVNMVMEHGEFAVRGGVIDVFAANQSHPVRVEYFGDEIERLNSFNVHSQCSISELKTTDIAVFKKSEVHFFSGNEESNEDVISALRVDDYIVHEDYGVGVYKGFTRLKLKYYEGEYILIKYAGKDKVYVPLDQINRIYSYQGADEKPVLSSLYDGSWQRAKEKVRKATEVLAEDIYLLYKLRQSKKGFVFGPDTEKQLDLEGSFNYQLTKDQEKAVADIKVDMESDKPMDRLLTGDVGFGKTEVLLRASFKAVENSKQVAILVPTTVLAEQHYRTFSKRFELFGYRVKVMSRFRSKKEQVEIVKGIKEQSVDVVIGTHRILQKDIEFRDLGLLVIDEEQRFGVDHKEKIKKMVPNVDVVTVSATPIPRTLYMSMTGARDLSNIGTPPNLRKPVFTLVSEYSDELVKKAIYYEVGRAGQVFYLYNKVRYIKKRQQELQKLFPDLVIGVAHGQMKEADLQKAMLDFMDKKTDILLCSTIIENGLDMRSVNTVILENAENFGLSQIHQLRGRVGRSTEQGYAYLLFPSAELLPEKAKKRLQAIREYAALGAGYKIALKDLEIRGAGSLLGRKQHGHIISVGFDLYCKLLEESVYKAKHKKPIQKTNIFIDPEVKAYIPEDYIADPRERFALYKRLMGLGSDAELMAIKYEIEDRYGSCPSLVEDFFESIRKKLL
jgi:transcription-repair coupling factor (superfamily II helicase)